MALGIVLLQKKEDGKVNLSQIASRAKTSAERNYSVCEREAPPAVFALQKFRLYLLSTQPFSLPTNQNNFKSTFATKAIYGRLSKWSDVLEKFGYEI